MPVERLRSEQEESILPGRPQDCPDESADTSGPQDCMMLR